MDYYVAEGTAQRGPFSVEQLRGMGLRADALVWAEGMAQWQPAGSVAGLRELFPAPAGNPGVPPIASAPPAAPSYMPPPQPAYASPPAQQSSGTKIAAGILGILLGGLGIHKFVIGCTGTGVLMLLVSIGTCGFGYLPMHLIGIVEGILYLTKSDEEFYQTYIVRKKAWF